MRKYILSILLLLFSVCLFAQNSEKADSISTIGNVFKNHELKVYPNPVIEYFYADYSIDFVKDAKLQIYNTLGKIVISKDLEDKQGNEKIYVSDLENGLYFCSLLIDDNRVVTKKILINR